MIKLSILGSTKLRRKDGSLDQSFLTGPKRLALLTYLMLAKPHRGFQRRDNLIALFWPEKGQKSARNALSNMTYHIRSALGKEIILSRGTEEISINRDKIWCDAIAFEEALDNGNPRKALDLYRGNLLMGFHVSDVSNEFQNWLDTERERLRMRAAEGAWELAEEAREAGNSNAARSWAKKATKHTPFDDDAHIRLITLLIDLGYRTEALQTYEEFANRLRSDWEMEPTDKLKSLVNNIQIQTEGRESASYAELNAPDSRKTGGISTTADSNPRKSLSKKDDSKLKRQLSAAAVLLVLIMAVWIVWRDSPVQNNHALAVPSQSVAVLPFTYINSPDSTDYFSLGITEEILSKLARIGDLSVTSRTSVMQYQNSEKSIREIAGDLGVSSVVEGSVQRHRDQVRITAQLIDAKTDRHLWGDTYDRQIENILDIQSEVASRIARALQAELLSSEQTLSQGERNVNEDAYHLYLQAKHLLDIREPKGVVQSIDLYTESIARDSTFAPAYGELALATLYSGMLSRFDYDVTEVRGLPLSEAIDLSRGLSNKALALDSTIVEAHLSEALIYDWAHRDWERSERSLLKALEINPNHSDVRIEYGFHLLRMGNIEEALIHMKKAVLVDPLSWASHHGLGYTYYCAREYESAIRELQTSINLGSLYPNTKKYLSVALLKRSQELFNNGSDEEAIAMIETGSEILDEIWGSDTGWKKTVIFAATGNKEKTLQSIEDNPLPSPPKLYSLLLIGQKDFALQMIDQRLNFSRNRVYVDPIFDTVRDDPRFKQMVERDLNREIQFD